REYRAAAKLRRPQDLRLRRPSADELSPGPILNPDRAAPPRLKAGSLVLTWGRLCQGLCIIESWSVSCFPACRSEPDLRAQRLLAGPTSHSVAVRDGSTMIPLSAERAQENETNLRNGSSGPRSRTVRSPGSARTDRVLEEGGVGGRGVCESGSGGLHDSPLDDEAGGHVFPQRHEQLARQGHDQRLLDAPAIGLDAIFEPQRQGRIGLMATPQPGQFDEGCSQARIAGLGGPLFALDAAAAPRRGREPGIGGDLTPIGEG